ncbi:hypothetical protein VPH35_022012 [Triticum aestivum]
MSVSNKHTICAYALLYWPHGSLLIDHDYSLFLQCTIAFSSQLKQQFMWLAQSGGWHIYSVYSLKLQVLKCIIFLCSQRAERGEAGGVGEGVRRHRLEQGFPQEHRPPCRILGQTHGGPGPSDIVLGGRGYRGDQRFIHFDIIVVMDVARVRFIAAAICQSRQ